MIPATTRPRGREWRDISLLSERFNVKLQLRRRRRQRPQTRRQPLWLTGYHERLEIVFSRRPATGSVVLNSRLCLVFQIYSCEADTFARGAFVGKVNNSSGVAEQATF